MTAQLPFDAVIAADILAVGAESFVNSEAMVAAGGLLKVEGFVEFCGGLEWGAPKRESAGGAS
jgi:hypothetical protein